MFASWSRGRRRPGDLYNGLSLPLAGVFPAFWPCLTVVMGCWRLDACRLTRCVDKGGLQCSNGTLYLCRCGDRKPQGHPELRSIEGNGWDTEMLPSVDQCRELSTRPDARFRQFAAALRPPH